MREEGLGWGGPQNPGHGPPRGHQTREPDLTLMTEEPRSPTALFSGTEVSCPTHHNDRLAQVYPLAQHVAGAQKMPLN